MSQKLRIDVEASPEEIRALMQLVELMRDSDLAEERALFLGGRALLRYDPESGSLLIYWPRAAVDQKDDGPEDLKSL